jgi:hypothetical protein
MLASTIFSNPSATHIVGSEYLRPNIEVRRSATKKLQLDNLGARQNSDLSRGNAVLV